MRKNYPISSYVNIPALECGSGTFFKQTVQEEGQILWALLIVSKQIRVGKLGNNDLGIPGRLGPQLLS